MRRSIGMGALASLGIVPLVGCRSAAEGNPARDIAAVSADVQRRTGAAASASDNGPAVESATAGLLAGPLTDERAVKLALLKNASVRESYERLGIARADLLQAGLLSNPVLVASAKFASAGTEVEFGLAQSFVELFYMPLRRRVAAEELCATEAQVTRTLVHLVFDVRRALVAVRAADEVVRIRREARTAVTAARDLMKTLHAAGNVRDSDLTIEEVGAARAQMQTDAAEVMARDAREALNVLLGLRPPSTTWTLEGALLPLPPASGAGDVEARALAASLDLLEAKARIAAALSGAGLAHKQGFFPHFDLGVAGTREASDGAWGLGPEFSTAIPIFDQGEAKVLAANAIARQHCAHHEQLTVEVAAAARRFLDRTKSLRAREAYLRETYLPLRARYVNDTVQTFNAMQIGAFDVLDAKEGEADARREHAETLAAAWIAKLDLAELLAGSLDRERLDALHLPETAERPTPPKGH